MLHRYTGCKQNALAHSHQIVLLCCEQRSKAAIGRFWNWFESAHLIHGDEPGVASALT